MPTPPTTSEIAPIAATAKVMASSTVPNTSSIFCCGVTVKSSAPWRATMILRMPLSTSASGAVGS
ncbi:hypothetical protein D3C83_109670 [compost metagenome]